MQATNFSDIELLESLRLRERTAVNAIYDKYAGALYAVILETVGEKQLANIILEKCFFAILDQTDQFNPERSRLFTWMLQVTKQTMKAFYPSFNLSSPEALSN